MYYTVISTSGWQGDYWRVEKTFQDKKKAYDYAASIKQHDCTEDRYNVRVMAHRKPLSKLMTYADGGGAEYKFNDGTRAIQDF